MKRTLLSISMITALFTANAQTNLNLESWTSQGTHDTPDGWFSFNDFVSFGLPVTVEQETMSVAGGSSAAKLITSDCPTCPQFQISDTLVGIIQQDYPITLTPTSLDFSYKYTPVGSDEGVAVIQYSHWDATNAEQVVDGQGVINLTSTTSWTTMSVPIVNQTGMTPDSCTITFGSSIGILFADQSLAPSGKGSELWIDEVSVIDAAASVEENGLDAKVYVAGNSIVLENNGNYSNGEVTILTSTGKLVKSINITSSREEIGTNFATGIYIVNVKFEEGNMTQRLFIK